MFGHVPGETPINDISGLKVKGIRTRAELNHFEANNVSKAIEKYIATRPTARSAPFNFAWCLRLHKEMFGEVWKWAGKIRTENLNIGVPFHLVQQELFNLLQDLEFWKDWELVEQAARLHHRAVLIHPFVNGNGRWARMLANIWLRRFSESIIRWPEEAIGTESPVRQEYLEAIVAADNGDFEPIVALHRRFFTTING
jgi:Fic-DOC domain mobile mystery protein B